MLIQARLWAAGVILALLLGSFGTLGVKLHNARADARKAHSALVAERLAAAEAWAQAEARALQQQTAWQQASTLSEKTYDQKLGALRMAARNVSAVAGGVRNVAPRGGSGDLLPRPTGPASKPDATTSDPGVGTSGADVPVDVPAGSLVDRCAETTLQLLGLQAYVRSLSGAK